MDRREAYNDQFAANEAAATVIKTIDIALDEETNLTLLKSLPNVKREELLVAVNFIKDNFSDKYGLQITNSFLKITNIKKGALHKQFITFVHLTIPTLCLMCDTDYTPLFQKDSATGDVECIRCKTFAHRDCYKQEDFDTTKGKVFMCQCCIQSIGKEKEDEEKKSNENENKQKEALTESSSSGSDSSDDEANWESVKKKKKHRKKAVIVSSSSSEDEEKSKPKKKRKKKRQICPKLLEGNCPHGAAGKDCDFTHKKKCQRFINYGTQAMHSYGCKFGNRCHFIHPHLCKNSISLNACYNEKCTLAHLKSTRLNPQSYEGESYEGDASFSRSRRPYNNHQNSSTQRSHGYNEQRNFHPKQQNYNNQTSWNYNETQNNSFLEETMKKFQQTMLQNMKQMMEAQFWEAQQAYYAEYPPLGRV